MRYVVGLGNMCENYAKTRHNIGFMVLDEIAKRNNLAWEVGLNSLTAQIGETILMKPATSMNFSGIAIRNLPVENMIVIYDDIDLELGKVRVREGGSDGGHRGVRSIISQAGTDRIKRIKMGVRTSLKNEIGALEFVLSDFTVEEESVVENMIEEVVPKIDISNF